MACLLALTAARNITGPVAIYGIDLLVPIFARGVVSNQTRAQSYREQAKRLREKAKHFNTPEIRKDMEAIARQYDLMAESMEQSEKKSQGGA